MKRRAAALLAVFLLPACEMTPESRKMLAQDLEDTLAIAAPLMGEDAAAYLAAVQALVAAIITDDGEFDFPGAFGLIRALEPSAVQALVANGQTPEQANAILALARFALRRLEASVRNPVTPPENDG